MDLEFTAPSAGTVIFVVILVIGIIRVFKPFSKKKD